MSRSVLGIMGVLGQVGGLIALLYPFLGYLITPFNTLSFRINVLNSMFKIKTKDKNSLHPKKDELNISFCDKIRHLLGCCEN